MGWLVNVTLWPLYPWEIIRPRIVQEAVWAPAPGWMGEEKLAPTGFRSLDSPTCRVVILNMAFVVKTFVSK
jgi:hypothetical protein